MKVISKNKKAFFDFEIISTYEAGIVLKGSEIKSIRKGSVNLKDSFVKINYNDEVFVSNMHISKYENSHKVEILEEKRARKLLLNKKEISKMKKSINEQGLTIVPTKIYFKNNYVKLEIALARGKKKHDKRQALKEKDLKREAETAMKRR